MLKNKMYYLVGLVITLSEIKGKHLSFPPHHMKNKGWLSLCREELTATQPLNTNKTSKIALKMQCINQVRNCRLPEWKAWSQPSTMEFLSKNLQQPPS